MNFPPILVRELRLISRQPAIYRTRALVALVVCTAMLGMLFLGFSGILTAASAGRNLFLTLSCLAYVFLLLEGTLITADALSQEKREGTLGLLFLTPLRGYDVVAGKLVSRASTSASCLLAGIPPLGLSIFLGGVIGGDLFRMTLALFNTLFFSAALGLLISALCWKERRALSLSLALALALGLALPGIGVWLLHAGAAAIIHPAFLIFSPAGAVLPLVNPGPAPWPGTNFWQGFWGAHLLAWLFLGLASWWLPNSWQDRTGTATAIKQLVQRSKTSPAASSRAGGFRDRVRWLDSNPILWLGERSRERSVRLTLWGLAAAWFLAWFIFGPAWLSLLVYAITALVLHLVLVVVVAAHACRGPSEDRRHGVLELLLTTPLGEDVLVQGRMLACKRAFLSPALFVLTADLILMAAGMAELPAGLNLIWAAGFLVLMGILLANLYAAAWIGFWQGLKAPSMSVAVRRTLTQVLLSHWLLALALFAIIGLLTQGEVFRSPESGILAGGVFFVFLAGCHLYFCGKAWIGLREELRTVTAQHLEWRPPPSKVRWFRGVPRPGPLARRQWPARSP